MGQLFVEGANPLACFVEGKVEALGVGENQPLILIIEVNGVRA